MELIGEYIERIQSDYSKGVQSKNTRLSDRHIYSTLVSCRSTLITRKANKNQSIDINTYQTLGCIEMTHVKTGLRSKFKIPKIVSSINGLMINSASNEHGTTIYTASDFKTEKYSVGNKFTGTAPNLIIDSGYLFITNKALLKYVRLSAVLNDPLEGYSHLFDCDYCADCCKSNYEYSFHLDSDLEDAVIKMTLAELMSIFSTGKDDKSNNANDDVNVGKIPQNQQANG